MRPNLGPRAQAGLLLALVATLGALAGVLGDRLLADRSGPHARGFMAERPGMRNGGGPGPWRFEAMPQARYTDRLAGTLALTPEQRVRIDGIVAEEQQRVRRLTDQVEPQFRSIAQETRSRIEAVLTPEQREQLGRLRRERMMEMHGDTVMPMMRGGRRRMP